MRSIRKDQQDIWFAEVTESVPQNAIDTVFTYSKPERHRFTISNEGGIPLEMGMGIVPRYERYITSYSHDFVPVEGMLCWVDATPELTDEGYIKVDMDGNPTVEPDFYVRRIMTNKKACVVRAAVVKVDGVKNRPSA